MKRLRTVFLYTKGTEGNPPEELRLLMQYMEDSTAENAKSERLKRLHEMVVGVKSDRKVGLAYMKWFEIEKRIRDEDKVEAIMELLEDFGQIPEKLEKRLWEQRNLDTLRKWHKLAARSKSIEEFETLISESLESVET